MAILALRIWSSGLLGLSVIAWLTVSRALSRLPPLYCSVARLPSTPARAVFHCWVICAFCVGRGFAVEPHPATVASRKMETTTLSRMNTPFTYRVPWAHELHERRADARPA